MSQLTLSEVSKRFKVNRATLYRAVASGRISRLANGKFDLSEVLRVYGDASSGNAPVPVTQSNDLDQSTTKLIKHLESELEFFKQQLEQKDNQIDHLQRLLVSPATFEQRNNAATCGDTVQHSVTPDITESEHNSDTFETFADAAKKQPETSQSVSVQHVATPDVSRGFVGRLGRGLKAFIK